MNARDRESARDSAPVTASSRESAGESGFNLSAWALRQRQLVIFLIGLATLFGVIGYTRLAQSEDPPFTFRTMVIKTYWPGATAREVQEQITDRIGRQLQAGAVYRQHQKFLPAWQWSTVATFAQYVIVRSGSYCRPGCRVSMKFTRQPSATCALRNCVIPIGLEKNGKNAWPQTCGNP